MAGRGGDRGDDDDGDWGAEGHSEDDPGHSCPCLWLAGEKFGVHCSQPTSEPPPPPLPGP